MLFADNIFFIFFSIFFPLYFLFRNQVSRRNLLTLVASYVFYGWWDWRFLGLIIISSAIDYYCGRRIDDPRSFAKKWYVYISVISNLSILFCFKYYGFFVENFNENILSALGLSPSLALNIILPVGISFYTFQSLSYTIDVYRGAVKAERNWVTFFCYVAFFPQLVAGPIERGAHLLPQFRKPAKISAEYILFGVRLFVWGFFFKVAMADTAALYANAAFSDPVEYGWTAVLGTFAFSIQIYCDFMGYSLMAKGCAAILGINLMTNFAFPYWSSSIQEFWRRWHISLSTWVRDYVYAPLGGNRGGFIRTILNLLLTMVLMGLWHGAAWTFVIWGGLHGVALVIHRIYRRFSGGVRFPTLAGWVLSMAVVVPGWFIFRIQSLEQANAVLAGFGDMSWTPGHRMTLIALLAMAFVLAGIEYFARQSEGIVPRFRRAGFEGLVLALVAIASMAASSRPTPDFVYFQF